MYGLEASLAVTVYRLVLGDAGPAHPRGFAAALAAVLAVDLVTATLVTLVLALADGELDADVRGGGRGGQRVSGAAGRRRPDRRARRAALARGPAGRALPRLPRADDADPRTRPAPGALPVRRVRGTLRRPGRRRRDGPGRGPFADAQRARGARRLD